MPRPLSHTTFVQEPSNYVHSMDENNDNFKDFCISLYLIKCWFIFFESELLVVLNLSGLWDCVSFVVCGYIQPRQSRD